jgi:hypothetical protein
MSDVIDLSGVNDRRMRKVVLTVTVQSLHALKRGVAAVATAGQRRSTL